MISVDRLAQSHFVLLALPVVWCVHDGGHAWPSLIYGCDADGGVCFDGGSAIWAFFSSFH